MADEQYNQLKALRALLDQGLLTREEFDQKRGEILAQTPGFVPSERQEDDDSQTLEASFPLRVPLLLCGVFVAFWAFNLGGSSEETEPIEDPHRILQTRPDRPNPTTTQHQAAETSVSLTGADILEFSGLIQEALDALQSAQQQRRVAQSSDDEQSSEELVLQKTEELRLLIAELENELPVDQNLDSLPRTLRILVVEAEQQISRLSSPTNRSPPAVRTTPVGVSAQARSNNVSVGFTPTGLWSDVLGEQTVTKSGSGYAELEINGFSIIDVPETEILEADASSDVAVKLAPGWEYVILGVCDNDCADLDLALMKNEVELDKDTTTDDWPLLKVTPTSSGDYTVRVTMYDCSAATCGYQLSIWRR